MKWVDYCVQTKSRLYYGGTEQLGIFDFSKTEDDEETEDLKKQIREWFSLNPLTNCSIVPAVDLTIAPESTTTVINMQTYSDIFAEGCDKGRAIRKFCELIGASIDQAICFGDSPNDIEMFRVCPTGICMANAPAELKAVSTYVAQGNYGVAEGIEWLLRDEKE